MDNVSYLEIFRRRWLALLIAVLLGTGTAALVAFTIPPTYSATATLFPVVDDPDASLAERSQFSLARVSSYTDLVRSSDVLEPVIDELGLAVSVQELSRRVSATNPSSTVNIEITARAGAAPASAEIANAVADSLSRLVSRVENVGTFSVTLERLIPALTPTAPSAPQKPVILGLGLLTGLAGGAIAALLLTRFDRRIRSVADVRRATGLPVIAAFPSTSRGADPRSADGPGPVADEAIARILQMNGGAAPRLMLIVPADPAIPSGGTRLALADAVAATGRRALLVESGAEATPPDARHGAEGDRGLAELLTGTATIPEVVRDRGAGRAAVLPAGSASVGEADAEAAFRGLVAKLLGSAETVVTQVQPTASPIGLAVVAPFADVSIVVVRHHRTTDLDLSRVVSRLRIAGVRPVGVLLVDTPRPDALDLMATWVPDDFAARPRKALTTPRRPAAPRKPPGE